MSRFYLFEISFPLFFTSFADFCIFQKENGRIDSNIVSYKSSFLLTSLNKLHALKTYLNAFTRTLTTTTMMIIMMLWDGTTKLYEGEKIEREKSFYIENLECLFFSFFVAKRIKGWDTWKKIQNIYTYTFNCYLNKLDDF